jgi:hypothetical protein
MLRHRKFEIRKLLINPFIHYSLNAVPVSFFAISQRLLLLQQLNCCLNSCCMSKVQSVQKVWSRRELYLLLIFYALYVHPDILYNFSSRFTMLVLFCSTYCDGSSKTVLNSLQKWPKSGILTAHCSPIRNSQNAKSGELWSGDRAVHSTGFHWPLPSKRNTHWF